MPDIKVSIIIPCYNVAQYLPRCLDSLVNQTLPDIEIICVNDASPDNGITILRDYEARYPNIRVIDLKENVRQGGARNRGMEIARGEYIGFVDSDDWVEPDMYEKLYAKAKETGADVVSCDYNAADDKGAILYQVSLQLSGSYGPINRSNRGKFIENAIGVVWNGIYKTEMLDKYKIRFPERMAYEDNLFRLRTYLHMEHCEHVPLPLYYYYQDANSTSHRRNQKEMIDRLKAFDGMSQCLNEYEAKEDFSRQINIVLSGMLWNAFTMYLRYTDQPEFSFIREIHRRMKTLRNSGFYSLRGKIKLKFFLTCPRLFFYLAACKSYYMKQ